MSVFSKKPVRLLVIPVLLGLFSCSLQEEVQLSSLRSIDLEGVSVMAAAEIVWTGTLKPHDIQVIRFNPVRDGTIRIRWPGSGNIPRDESVGYVTPNGGQKHDISILPNDTLMYKIGNSD